MAAKELWEGMRVLAIDEDRVCLKILEAKLRRCNYDVTPVKDGKNALRALGKARAPFDLVITELYVPGMDACDLIRKIDREMGIPVIVVSAYEDMMTVRNGLSSGACCYLAKPACPDQLKNIWQHVLRRKNELARNHKSSGNTVADQRLQTAIAEAEQGAKSTRKNSRRKRNDGDDSDENSGKKPRVRWTRELHDKFVEAFNRLDTGTDQVVPRRIFSMMDVDYISRKSIGSHKQKYRKHLKISSDPKALAAMRWTSFYNNMSSLESFKRYHEHQMCPAASSTFASSSLKNRFVTPSIQPGTVKHGGSTLKDVLSPLPGESRKSKDFAKALGGLIVMTNQGKASSYLDEEMLEPVNLFPVQLPQLVNQSSVLMNAHAFFQKQNAPATSLVRALGDPSMFPDLVGNFNNFCQTAASSKFLDLLHKDGSSLGPSEVNAYIPKINQLASFAGASSGHIQTVLNRLQNQQVPNPMAAFISNTTPLACFKQQMAPASNTCSVEMFINGKFAPGCTSSMSLPSLQTSNYVTPTQMVNGLSNSSALPNIEADSCVLPTEMLNGRDAVSNIQTGNYITLDQIVNGLRNSSTLPNIEAESSVAPAQMLNGGDAVGILPAQEGIADQQAPNGQLNNNDDFSWDDIDVDMFDQNSIEDDALLKNFIEDDDLLKNSVVDDNILKNSIVDDDLLKNSFEDDSLLKSFFGDDGFLKNSIEDDALLKKFSEVDDLFNGDWF